MQFLKKVFSVKISYFIIFFSLVAWAFFGYSTMNQLIDSQKQYAKLINISGKQRMLSQKTTLMAKIVYETNNKEKKSHLIELIKLMKSDHDFLIKNFPSKHIKTIYFSKPYSLNKNVKEYFDLLDSFAISMDKKTLDDIQNYSFNLLPKLNYAVYELENESDQITNELDQREVFILIGTIITLLLEAFFIIRPTLNVLRESKNTLENFNKKLEKKVQEQTVQIQKESNLKKLYLNTASILIVAFDKKANITMINKTGLNILEYEENELIGKNWFELDILPKNKIENLKGIFNKIMEGKINPTSDHYENELISKSGKVYLFQWSNALLKEDNQIIGILSSAADITKQKEQDKILAEQSKLAAMGEMIGNIAHQWRQPLSVISTGATGLKLQKEYNQLTDEIFFSTCDLIDENAQYLSQTIEDFKNFIKGDTKEVRFDLKNNTDSFLKLVNSTIKNYNIHVILDLQEDIRIQGYPNELIQCFINIFNNAKDELLKQNEDERYIFISQKVKKDAVVIRFKDNAGGIPENIISNIFEPYFTTKHESLGTGLGLSMTYNLIVTSMQGSITAQNEEFVFNNKNYKGALFTIKIPI